MTEEQKSINEHSVYLINHLSDLLIKVHTNELTLINKYGLSMNEENEIRSKIMSLVKKIY